jgi:DNA-binding GntR family transcriptional regulator
MITAADKAYQVIRERIVRGEYAPATRITEHELAATIGVSRTPVREALRRLHAEGLLEFGAHRGAVVTGWTTEDRDDLFELRAALEARGAAQAARKMTRAGIAELRHLAETQYNETKRKASGYLERIGSLNGQFHRLIYTSAGSSHLANTLHSLVEAPAITSGFEFYRDEDLMRSLSHHMEIVRAIEARDSNWCSTLMRSHILGARAVVRMRAAEHVESSAGLTHGDTATAILPLAPVSGDETAP